MHTQAYSTICLPIYNVKKMLSQIIFLNKKASIGFFFPNSQLNYFNFITLYLHLFNISFKILSRKKPYNNNK